MVVNSLSGRMNLYFFLKCIEASPTINFVAMKTITIYKIITGMTELPT